jgi:hypothetical protein
MQERIEVAAQAFATVVNEDNISVERYAELANAVVQNVCNTADEDEVAELRCDFDYYVLQFSNMCVV